MSLDVCLTIKDAPNCPDTSGIFIREDGQNKEISREEWDRRYPGVEPAVAMADSSDEVYSANITHNLGTMAEGAGIYHCLWRPDEIGISKAGQLIEPLRAGLVKLEGNPAHFKELNPPNGWGTYEGLVEFVRNYLAACEQYPDAEVSVWR